MVQNQHNTLIARLDNTIFKPILAVIVVDIDIGNMMFRNSFIVHINTDIAKTLQTDTMILVHHTALP